MLPKIKNNHPINGKLLAYFRVSLPQRAICFSLSYTVSAEYYFGGEKRTCSIDKCFFLNKKLNKSRICKHIKITERNIS